MLQIVRFAEYRWCCKLYFHCSQDHSPQPKFLDLPLFSAPMNNLIHKHGLGHHIYADDTGICTGFDFDNMDDDITRVTACAAQISSWMLSNLLKLREDTTKLLIMFRWTTFQDASVTIRGSMIQPARQGRHLGVTFGQHMTMKISAQSEAESMATCVLSDEN